MQQKNMSDNQGYSLAQQYRRWYKLSRKARRESFWLKLFKELFKILLPEYQYCQLLISEEDMFEHFQLFFNSSITCHEIQKGNFFQDNPLIDFIICLEGVLQYTTLQNVNHEWKNNQIVVLPNTFSLKNEKMNIKAIQNCTCLRIDRKAFQKFKNDILRQDRDAKENFMSNFLFCNFTPVYYITTITVLYVKENHQVQIKAGCIYLLYEGVIKRKLKREKMRQGTQLTKGCIINCKSLALILDQNDMKFQQETYDTKVDSIVLSFQIQEMNRILRLNVNLKNILTQKLRTIFVQRKDLCKKSGQIRTKFSDKVKLQNQSIQFQYSVQFKGRNIRSASPASRSFRKMNGLTNSYYDCGQFITFDKYDKMIESKEKVLLKKNSYASRQKRRQRMIYTPDYQKKIKMQNRMIKIQTGKIQKISQRDSKKQCSSQQLQEIKKNLFQVTHLFDEPFHSLQPTDKEFKTLTKCPKTLNNLSQAEHRNTRVSNLKPQDYLKNEYFSQFNSKSRVRYSLKDLQLHKQDSNKQNLIDAAQRTDINFIKNGKSNNRLFFNQVQ